MKFITNFKYRPEIDGLRALAVLAVLFYHVGLGFPGGYIGVDIFFVISGFLISSLIIKEIQEDRFSFSNFYERRFRRILPAGMVMVLITMIMGWFLLLPSDFIGLGKSVVSQTFFSSNIYFWRNTNYFAESAELQPLLHTWSLAVEEQFYVLMPLLLWGLFRIAKLKTRAKLVIVLSTIFLISLILSIYTLPKMPALTFYLLPTRAWELLIGSLVALTPSYTFLNRSIVREFLVSLGLVGMILPCFLFTTDTLFPGIAALAPCLGTAFFILGASPQPNSKLPFAARIFTWRPIIFIGLISYSLYLWHWPLIAFSNYWALEEISTLYKWGVVGVSFLLAIASWRFVETPFRVKAIAGSRKLIFSYTAAASLVFVLVGSTLIIMNGFTGRFNEKVIAYDNAKQDNLPINHIISPLNLNDAISGKFPIYGGSNSENIDVLVWGDSHARSILPGVIAAAGKENVVASTWYSATAPVINHKNFSEFSMGQKSPVWAEAIIEHVRKKQIPHVILVARWSSYYETILNQSALNSMSAIDDFNSNLLKTVTLLQDSGAKVWVLKEVPNHQVSVLKALAKEEIFGINVSQYKCTKDQLITQNKIFDSMQSKLELAGAKVIDASELLYNYREKNYRIKYEGVALYYDNNHLTKNGARKISEVFDPVFSESDTKVSIIQKGRFK